MLRIFFDLKDVLDGKPYNIKIVSGKYVTDKLKNKQPELKTQREMPLGLDKENEPKS